MSFLSKWNGWKRNEWDDKNSYFIGINASYFNSGSGGVYIPLVGSTTESSNPASEAVQFIPPDSGRLVSITTFSSNVTAPGSTVVFLRHNGGPFPKGSKTITIASQTLETFNFTDEIDSGTFEWDINDGTSLSINIDPTNAPDSLNVFVLFEIYK